MHWYAYSEPPTHPSSSGVHIIGIISSPGITGPRPLPYVCIQSVYEYTAAEVDGCNMNAPATRRYVVIAHRRAEGSGAPRTLGAQSGMEWVRSATRSLLNDTAVLTAVHGVMVVKGGTRAEIPPAKKNLPLV